MFEYHMFYDLRYRSDILCKCGFYECWKGLWYDGLDGSLRCYKLEEMVPND